MQKEPSREKTMAFQVRPDCLVDVHAVRLPVKLRRERRYKSLRTRRKHTTIYTDTCLKHARARLTMYIIHEGEEHAHSFGPQPLFLPTFLSFVTKRVQLTSAK